MVISFSCSFFHKKIMAVIKIKWISFIIFLFNKSFAFLEPRFRGDFRYNKSVKGKSCAKPKLLISERNDDEITNIEYEKEYINKSGLSSDFPSGMMKVRIWYKEDYFFASFISTVVSILFFFDFLAK